MLRRVVLNVLRSIEESSLEHDDIKKLIEFTTKIYGKPFKKIEVDLDDQTELTEEQLTTLKSLLIAAKPDPNSLSEKIIYQLFDALFIESIKNEIAIEVAPIQKRLNAVIKKLGAIEYSDKIKKAKFNLLILKYHLVILQAEEATKNTIAPILRKQLMVWLDDPTLSESASEIIYDALLGLAEFAPVHDKSLIDGECIPENNRIYISTGYVWDLYEIGLANEGKDNLVDPFFNKPFSIRDEIHIRKEAAEKGIEFNAANGILAIIAALLHQNQNTNIDNAQESGESLGQFDNAELEDLHDLPHVPLIEETSQNTAPWLFPLSPLPLIERISQNTTPWQFRMSWPTEPHSTFTLFRWSFVYIREVTLTKRSSGDYRINIFGRYRNLRLLSIFYERLSAGCTCSMIENEVQDELEIKGNSAAINENIEIILSTVGAIENPIEYYLRMKFVDIANKDFNTAVVRTPAAAAWRSDSQEEVAAIEIQNASVISPPTSPKDNGRAILPVIGDARQPSNEFHTFLFSPPKWVERKHDNPANHPNNFYYENTSPNVIWLLSITRSEYCFAIDILINVKDYLANDNNDTSGIIRNNRALADALCCHGIYASHPRVEYFPDERLECPTGRLTMLGISQLEISPLIAKIIEVIEFLEGVIDANVKAQILSRCEPSTIRPSTYGVLPRKEPGWKRSGTWESHIIYHSNRNSFALNFGGNWWDRSYKISLRLLNKSKEERLVFTDLWIKVLKNHGIDNSLFPIERKDGFHLHAPAVQMSQYIERILAAAEELVDEFGNLKEGIINFFKRAASLQHMQTRNWWHKFCYPDRLLYNNIFARYIQFISLQKNFDYFRFVVSTQLLFPGDYGLPGGHGLQGMKVFSSALTKQSIKPDDHYGGEVIDFMYDHMVIAGSLEFIGKMVERVIAAVEEVEGKMADDERREMIDALKNFNGQNIFVNGSSHSSQNCLPVLPIANQSTSPHLFFGTPCAQSSVSVSVDQDSNNAKDELSLGDASAVDMRAPSSSLPVISVLDSPSADRSVVFNDASRVRRRYLFRLGFEPEKIDQESRNWIAPPSP